MFRFIAAVLALAIAAPASAQCACSFGATFPQPWLTPDQPTNAISASVACNYGGVTAGSSFAAKDVAPATQMIEWDVFHAPGCGWDGTGEPDAFYLFLASCTPGGSAFQTYPFELYTGGCTVALVMDACTNEWLANPPANNQGTLPDSSGNKFSAPHTPGGPYGGAYGIPMPTVVVTCEQMQGLVGQTIYFGFVAWSTASGSPQDMHGNHIAFDLTFVL